jgi:ribonuclease HII
MGILIGMDEAGYGPNLGPLVVAATAWKLEEGAGSRESGVGKKKASAAGGVCLASAATPKVCEFDLYRRLRRVVSVAPSDTHIAIADSKALYKPGSGLRQLERGVHAVLTAIGRPAACWSEAVDAFAADADGACRQLCWHDDFDCPLPVDATCEELLPLGGRLQVACDRAGMRPLAIRARLIYPAEFNELCEKYASKGAALSHVTIGLLREVMGAARTLARPLAEASSPVYAVCDKHGARNRYAALLQHHFADDWIEAVCEGHVESCYQWGPPESRVECVFRMKGEAFLPTALASMTAKYLRELAMRAFNEFWCARVPGLRPTAGYPTDAPRFKQAIAAVQRELGVDDHLLWRNR